MCRWRELAERGQSEDEQRANGSSRISHSAELTTSIGPVRSPTIHGGRGTGLRELVSMPCTGPCPPLAEHGWSLRHST